MSNKVTQSQLTTQGQLFAANLAPPETMIEQVLNDAHAIVKQKIVSNKGVKLS
jgi:hypothetical protein